MNTSEIVGIIAGIATTASFVPQAYKVYKTKRTHDLSAGMFTLLAFGLIFWLMYGIQKEAVSIIFANSVTLVLTLYILIMKIKHK
ncbi:MAG: SemiSWEET transporter [Spirochaetes bacterium]|nr:SemiSWEET transporter [Spirochaetota bacterium]